MTQKKAQVDMMHVEADISQIASLLRQLNITGPMRDYCEKRLVNAEIAPSLAASAAAQAKSLIESAHLGDTSSGVSSNVLNSLLKDISAFARVAASRSEINKLADLFEKALVK